MVYVDPLFACKPSRKWPYSQACHMLGDTSEELHLFAAQLGLKRAWYQDHHKNTKLHHYDLTPSKRAQALRLGAKEITRQELAALIR